MRRLSGQQKLARLLGKPAPGMSWCTGFQRPNHQVPKDQIKPLTCRCFTCHNGYHREYQRQHPRLDKRTRARQCQEAFDRPVPERCDPPGNDGSLQFRGARSWGYLGNTESQPAHLR